MKTAKKAFVFIKAFIKIVKRNKELQELIKQMISGILYAIIALVGFTIYSYLLISNSFQSHQLENSTTMNVILFILILNGLTLGRVSFGDFFDSQDEDAKKISYLNYVLMSFFIILLFL